MKRIRIFLFVIALVFSIACEKKEEHKGATPPFSGPVQIQGKGQLEEQVRMLQDTAAKNPQDDRTWIHLGNLLMDSGRFQDAIDAYQKALQLDPGNVDVRVDMGTCYRNIGQPEKAVIAYNKAITINPKHINAHRNLGVVAAFDLKDKKLAASEFEEYLRLAPGAPDAAQVRQLIASLKTP